MSSSQELPKILLLHTFGAVRNVFGRKFRKYVLSPDGVHYYRVHDEHDDGDRFSTCGFCKQPLEYVYRKKSDESKGRVFLNHKCPPKRDQVDKMLNTRGHETYEDYPTFARRLSDGFDMLAMAGDID